MLRFHPAAERDLPRLRREGLPEGAPLLGSIEAARREAGGPRGDDAGRVLVVSAVAHQTELDEASGDAPALPPSALENLGPPYRPPEPVTAGGGYVLRAGEQSKPLPARQLLLIHRRGVWDLPKGKQDPGEDVRACALREVREETGLGAVLALGALGPTVHGYEDTAADGSPRYAVKTTHWFLMETPEADLTPQCAEGIEKAVWAPWAEARPRLGYETLRRHHARAGSQARALLKVKRDS